MELILKLRPDLAETVRGGGATRRLADALRLFDIVAQPMHPNRTSGPLSTYFTVDAPPSAAMAIQSGLSVVDGVESIHIQPQAAV